MSIKINDLDFKNKTNSLLEEFWINRINREKNKELFDLFKTSSLQMLCNTYAYSSHEEFVKKAFDTFISASDQTIWGTSVVQEIMSWLSIQSGRGKKSSNGRLDLTDNDGTAIQIKTQGRWGNASSRQQLDEDLNEANADNKILLISEGSNNKNTNKNGVLELTGSPAWEFCSGDPSSKEVFEKYSFEFIKNNSVLVQKYNSAYQSNLLSMIDYSKNNFSNPDGSINFDFIRVAFNKKKFVSTNLSVINSLHLSKIDEEIIPLVFQEFPNNEILNKGILISSILKKLDLSPADYSKIDKHISLLCKKGKLLQSQRGSNGGVRRLFALKE